MADDLDDVVAGRLRDLDQRYTPNRRALVRALQDGRALTIPELLQAIEGLPQSSAYRNLTVLEQAGVVRRIQGTSEHARYELAEELTEHHHHLICTRCGSVDDCTLPPALEVQLDRALQRTARRSGFRGDHHRLDLFGLCARCA